MIALTELYHPDDYDKIDENSMLNLAQLHYRLNFLRRLTPFAWIINRGFSTSEEQIAIYKAKGLPPKMGSEHLSGNAVDVADPEGKLKLWILQNLDLIEQLHLFLEDFDHTETWTHIQQMPYQSWLPGKPHFFIP